jgi:hypothetical protein
MRSSRSSGSISSSTWLDKAEEWGEFPKNELPLAELGNSANLVCESVKFNFVPPGNKENKLLVISSLLNFSKIYDKIQQTQ